MWEFGKRRPFFLFSCFHNRIKCMHTLQTYYDYGSTCCFHTLVLQLVQPFRSAIPPMAGVRVCGCAGRTHGGVAAFSLASFADNVAATLAAAS